MENLAGSPTLATKTEALNFFIELINYLEDEESVEYLIKNLK